jgi:hypothetical protein
METSRGTFKMGVDPIDIILVRVEVIIAEFESEIRNNEEHTGNPNHKAGQINGKVGPGPTERSKANFEIIGQQTQGCIAYRATRQVLPGDFR